MKFLDEAFKELEQAILRFLDALDRLIFGDDEEGS